MPIAEDGPNSDGLEIASIGTLYDGPWDKKYWSSSRGKDRYPYPIGYLALRTHNGVTYKMEIHEGSAGPVFQITCGDGHSGSGQTPDIACAAFQRKTSRIKLWRTKRFTCKVDGVEFFGFKNTLVQRLLRELVASLDGRPERSSPSINIGNGSLATEGHTPFVDFSKQPDLLSYLTNSRITGKRSKKCVTTDLNSAPKASSKKFLNNDKVENLELVSSLRKEYVICNAVQDFPSSVNLNHHQVSPASAAQLSCKFHQYSSDCEDKCYSPHLERQHLEDGGYLQSKLANIEHIELDRLKCLEVQNVNPPVPSEHKVEKSETVNDSEALEDSEIIKNGLLIAPDTLDTQQVDNSFPIITSAEEPWKEKDAFGADNMVKFSELVGDSSPEEETNNDSAYMSDFDSVGKEVAKSMMAVLLPQALPLLTYSSKKRKRKCHPMVPMKESVDTLRIDHDNNKTLPSVDVASSGELDGNSNFDRQKEDHVQNMCPGSAFQSTEISVACDRIQSNSCEADLTYQGNSRSDVTASVEANLEKHKLSADKLQVLPTLKPIMEAGTFQSKMDLKKKTMTCIPTEYHVSATSSSEKPSAQCIQHVQTEVDVANQIQRLFGASDVVAGNSAADTTHEAHTSMLASAVDCTCNGKEVQKSMDNCLHLQDTSGIKSESWKGESDATSNAGQIPYNTLGLVNSQRIPAEEQCIRGNSSIRRSSSLELFRRNYISPLSESTICRNVGYGSLIEEEASSFGNESKDAAFSPSIQLYDLLDKKMHEAETSSKLECNTQFIGCYSLPKRISAVMLKQEGDNIHVCASCGLLEENGRDLFLYKLRIKDPSLGRPSFIGSSTIILPVLKDFYGREVPIERSALQFTPDARGLVMFDTIQLPCCSERTFSCQCSNCASISFDDNAVKIVQVKKGYVSLLVKVKTLNSVNCVLVCEPNCLVALDMSGRLYLWFMDPIWSASTEDYVIPTYDFVASRVVELKRIPRSASLLLGHNGCGDFSLWDITSRTTLSRFSAPASSIHGFLPINSFSWQNGHLYDKNDVQKCKDELMAATTTCLTEFNGERIFLPREGEDIGIWILACTFSDSSCQKSTESWRLGLLVKDMVILGTSLPRSAAIGVSGGHGIIATEEGLAYMWDLKTGNKVEMLHNFSGVGVSHIATDDSTPSATAVACESGQLWIYLHL